MLPGAVPQPLIVLLHCYMLFLGCRITYFYFYVCLLFNLFKAVFLSSFHKNIEVVFHLKEKLRSSAQFHLDKIKISSLGCLEQNRGRLPFGKK